MHSIENQTEPLGHTWVSVVGARPQFVKLAPICRAIEKHNAQLSEIPIDHRIIHTGQHYDRDMAELLFEQMAIPMPDYNLAVGSSSHGSQLARMMQRMEPILKADRINWVIVYGDTNSTLAGALLAARLKIPLAHIEAGCRSFDLGQPEEQNRIVADHLSQLLLAPSTAANENLRREGIGGENDPQKRVSLMVGDVMYDALLQHLTLAEKRTEPKLKELKLKSKEYYLLTLHRAENTNNRRRLAAILKTVMSLDLPVLFPVHPRTKQVLSLAGIYLNSKIRTIPPVGFLEMIALEKNALKILTDSGGVQKEAFYLGVPCITLRDQTEWPETVTCGANQVAGTDPDSIREAVRGARHSDWSKLTVYGDGNTAVRIVDQLLVARAH
jgi:UDP-N-acetylglucosamine 2-epimerase